MRALSKSLVVGIAVVTIGAAASCSEPVACGCSVYPSVPSATKSTDGSVRHDLAPLITRWPLLDGATAAAWASGTTGDDRIPGPTTYWIDAVVTVPHQRVSALATKYSVTTSANPSVVKQMRSLVPETTVTNPALNDAFALAGWQTTVYLSIATDQIVVTALGDAE